MRSVVGEDEDDGTIEAGFDLSSQGGLLGIVCFLSFSFLHMWIIIVILISVESSLTLPVSHHEGEQRGRNFRRGSTDVFGFSGRECW